MMKPVGTEPSAWRRPGRSSQRWQSLVPALAFPLCLAALLSACGGGESSGARPQAEGKGDAREVRYRTAASEPRAIDAGTLLNWAEGAYPWLFPGRQANSVLDAYTYRYYPETGNYVGTAGGAVVVMGPITGGELISIGQLRDFHCQVYPAECTGQFPQNAAYHRIAAGPGYTMVVTAQGGVLTWGDGATGARKTPIPGSTAGAVNGLAGVAGVYAAADYSLAVTRAGQVYGWGRQYQGVFGPSDATPQVTSAPIAIPGLTETVSVAACGHGLSSRIYALRADGTLLTMPGGAPIDASAPIASLGSVDPRRGIDECGPLGSGGGFTRQFSTSTNTTRARDYPSFVQSSCSGLITQNRNGAAGGHCLGVTADGLIWSWGDNDAGQLGNGTAQHWVSGAPTRVGNLPPIARVEVYGKASYALTRSGELWAWGEHVAPDGSASRLSPARLFAQVGPIADFAANTHVALLMRDGTVLSFGANEQGQLGNGSHSATTLPVRAAGVQLGTPADVDMPPVARLFSDGATPSVGSPVSFSAWLSRDPNGDPLSYRWTLATRPEGSTVQLSATSTEAVSFTPDTAGEYRIELVVGDGKSSASKSASVVAATPATMDPMQLARSHGCLACHTIDKRLVGPSFLDIARRYKGQAAAQAALESRVRTGGVGVWGPVPMPANPRPTSAEIEQMVRAILSL